MTLHHARVSLVLVARSRPSWPARRTAPAGPPRSRTAKCCRTASCCSSPSARRCRSWPCASTRAPAPCSIPPDSAGLANLTGATLTRGTAKRPGPELDAAIEFVGGSLEAGAGRDGMTVSLSVLKKDLDLGLDLLQEVVLSPAFPEAEVKRKVGEIQAGIKRSEESPEAVAARALAPLVYDSHPYARPIEGTMESVGKLTRDDVVAFYRERVRPDTAIVAVVGAITVDEARAGDPAPVRGLEGAGRLRRRRSPDAPPMPAPAGDSRSRAISRSRRSCSAGRPSGRPIPTISRWPSRRTSSAAARPRVSTAACATRAARRIRSTATSRRHAPAPSLVVGTQTRTSEVPKVIDAMRGELARMTPRGRHAARARSREVVPDRQLPVPARHLVEGRGLPRRDRGAGSRARLRRSLSRQRRARHRGGRAARRGQVSSRRTSSAG